MDITSRSATISDVVVLAVGRMFIRSYSRSIGATRLTCDLLESVVSRREVTDSNVTPSVVSASKRLISSAVSPLLENITTTVPFRTTPISP
jgi:hypothetical protein